MAMNTFENNHSHFPSSNRGSEEALRPSPLHSQEIARIHLTERGALVLEDDRTQRAALNAVCTNNWRISPDRMLLIPIEASDTLPIVVDRVETLLTKHFEATGSFPASIITDYNLAPQITSLEVWRAVDFSFARSGLSEPWGKVGRVLVTGARINHEIQAALDSERIDFWVSKPFKISTLTAAVESSILKRL